MDPKIIKAVGYLVQEGFEVGSYLCPHCGKFEFSAHWPYTPEIECSKCKKWILLRGPIAKRMAKKKPKSQE